ncbi:MAG: MG2 domain-containing protein, partial [Saprospiraceae bacterium]
KALPVSKVYKPKKLEFCHPKLSFGQYALLVRSNENEGQISQFLIFHVSDLVYSTFVANSSRHFLVTDRLSGQPIQGAILTLYRQNYDARIRKNELIKSGSYITDNLGKAVIADLQEKNFKVVASKGKDLLDLNQFHYNYGNYQPESHSFAEIFTDRAIYRPGQIVYFKAILLNNDQKNVPSILPDLPVEVVFRDANYQEVSKLKLTSNQFGSSSGSFTIPLGRLNGSFTITVGTSPNKMYGQKQILVEEYKRPTFEIKTDAITAEYKLGDSVLVTGSAMTLAGTPVDGAQIKYKVVRTARFPGWGWWWRMPYTSNDFIVSQGESTTDGEGKFKMSFVAIPDLKVNKKDLPVFTYKIEIDVTDQRGETRSVMDNISVGYTAFSLSANFGAQLDKSEMDSLKIVATSTNGVALEAKGNVKIFQLKAPDQVTIAKYWDGRVDHPIERTHREKIFPYYESNATNGISGWEIDKKMIDQAFQTKEAIDIIEKIGAGAYKIEMEAKDKYGRDVTAVHYFVMTDFEKNKFPKSEFLFSILNKTSLQPG